MEVVYEINLCRIRTLNNKIFGTLKDVDNTVYEAYEIQIHTPGEHTISQYQTDMEIQVIHRAIEGKMQNQAILSFLYRRTPGAIRKVFEVFDVLNLPNPVYNKGQNVMKGDLNVNQFMFDDLFSNPPPFAYYKYKGSNTQPPCAENVVWFVVEKMQEVSSTILVMFR
jgi:carbonic anhydrase